MKKNIYRWQNYASLVHFKYNYFTFSTDGDTTVRRDHAKARMKVSDLSLLHLLPQLDDL